MDSVVGTVKAALDDGPAVRSIANLSEAPTVVPD